MSDSATPWTAAWQTSLFFTISRSLLKLTSIELVMLFQLSHSLSCPSPPSLNPSQNQGLSNELSIHIRWPKYWSFSISLCNEYSGLISFSINWFDLLAVQRILKSLLVSKFQNLIYWRKILQLMSQAILFPFFLSYHNTTLYTWN